MPKGDYLAAKTHCPAGHPYDEENTARTKAGGRYCRTCVRERSSVQRQTPERQEYERAWVAANRGRVNEIKREYRKRTRGQAYAYWLWSAHGLRPEDLTEIWDAQGGKCYLCGDEIDKPNGTQSRSDRIGTTTVIEHDHSCCPQSKSCWICRRGLAHAVCNQGVGQFGDDPARLRRAADALEAAIIAVQGRRREAAG
jgi:hypothetical protein